MELIVAKHPLIAHKLTHLRSTSTATPLFRALVDELVTLLAYEATGHVRTQKRHIVTPIAEMDGIEISDPQPLVVPILRAGLGMLNGMTHLMPTAEVGFVGMVRDEETLQPFTYAERLPENLEGRQCFVLDPMLATGGSLAGCIEFLVKRGAGDITCICLLAAPEGVEHVRRLVDEKGISCTLVVGAVDEKLNEHGYIVPGLGDAGDRLYGVID